MYFSYYKVHPVPNKVIGTTIEYIINYQTSSREELDTEQTSWLTSTF